jgi:acyl-CoA hydrolase
MSFRRPLKVGDVVDLEGSCEVVAFPQSNMTVFEPVVQQRTMNLSVYKPPKGKVKVIRVRKNAKVVMPKGQYINFYI